MVGGPGGVGGQGREGDMGEKVNHGKIMDQGD